jgi:hypothetical protein
MRALDVTVPSHGVLEEHQRGNLEHAARQEFQPTFGDVTSWPATGVFDHEDDVCVGSEA